MNNPTLGHIWEALSDYERTGTEPALSSVVVDSREALPGALFVALEGEKVDGHDYVADAFEHGAIAALVDRNVTADCSIIDIKEEGTDGVHKWNGILPVCILVEDSTNAMQEAAKAWRQQIDVRVIGITGSVGKSSTKELAHSVLAQHYQTYKSPGNRNSILGLPPALFDLRPEHERAVLEMGMYTPGEIERLCELTNPEIGVMTMIGPAHLERAGTMEAIVAAKRELVEALPEFGVAILNRDDDLIMDMVPYTKARIFTYGLDDRADLWAGNIHSMGLSGVQFTLHYQGESLPVSVPMLGRHSVHTCLRAAALGIVEGLSWEEIIRGLSEIGLSQFRLVAVSGPNDSIIIDDTYNSSPDSAMAALNLLSELEGRHLAVLGDMLELGWAEEESHRLIARRAADVADIIIAIGPRSKIIASEAQQIGKPEKDVYWVPDSPSAIPILQEIICPKDVILVKGSLGMAMDQIVLALAEDN